MTNLLDVYVELARDRGFLNQLQSFRLTYKLKEIFNCYLHLFSKKYFQLSQERANNRNWSGLFDALEERANDSFIWIFRKGFIKGMESHLFLSHSAEIMRTHFHKRHILHDALNDK